jgi:uncharacterized protein YkwD
LKLAAVLLAGCSMAAAHAAHGDVLGDLNWARLHACKAPAARSAFTGSVALDKAAARLSNGIALRDALQAVGYRASETAALHFSGQMSDADITQALSTNYCRTVSDTNFRDMGVARRGRELWIVIAAPVAMLGAADAESASATILQLVNAARAAGRRCGAKYFAPAAALTFNVHLTGAALAHSRDMAQSDAFDHRGQDGSTPALRVERAGYGAHSIVGENIAAGVMTPAEAAAGWLASPRHCENIMDARFTEIGIAFASNSHSEMGMYWTQDFAAPLR